MEKGYTAGTWVEPARVIKVSSLDSNIGKYTSKAFPPVGILQKPKGKRKPKDTF